MLYYVLCVYAEYVCGIFWRIVYTIEELTVDGRWCHQMEAVYLSLGSVIDSTYHYSCPI